MVQELVNTLDVETGEDALDTREGLARFGVSARERGELRELRELLRAACLAHAGTPIPPGAGHALARHLGRAWLALDVGRDGDAALRPAEGLDGVAELTARIAAGVAVAAVDGSWRRLKACAAGDCQWVYYDRSPAGRSRWCTMAVCGSRAKMRGYRARRRPRG
nr:CGNR zinc finger domain-containing protein [Streptomyces boncukensis]